MRASIICAERGIAMWSKKVLVAYDGSEPSHKALEIARGIGTAASEMQFLFLHIMRMDTQGASMAGINDAIVNDALKIEEELQNIADEMPNQCDVIVMKGTSPADVILNCARDHSCDLIIMGSRGQGGIKGYLGSVSYKVTKDSPVTVIIAK